MTLSLRISWQYFRHNLQTKAEVASFVSILDFNVPARVDLNLRFFPYLSGRILKPFERLRKNLAAVAWLGRHHVMASGDMNGIPKVFVEVVDIFDDSIVQRAGDA